MIDNIGVIEKIGVIDIIGLTHCLRASAVAVVAYPPGKRVKILFVTQVNEGVEPYYFCKLLLVNTLNLAFFIAYAIAWLTQK